MRCRYARQQQHSLLSALPHARTLGSILCKQTYPEGLNGTTGTALHEGNVWLAVVYQLRGVLLQGLGFQHLLTVQASASADLVSWTALAM